jgi:hypothetical protein
MVQDARLWHGGSKGTLCSIWGAETTSAYGREHGEDSVFCHIRYRILHATNSRVQVDMVRRFGDTRVPRTVIGGVVVNGVDETRIKQLCR